MDNKNLHSEIAKLLYEIESLLSGNLNTDDQEVILKREEKVKIENYIKPLSSLTNENTNNVLLQLRNNLKSFLIQENNYLKLANTYINQKELDIENKKETISQIELINRILYTNSQNIKTLTLPFYSKRNFKQSINNLLIGNYLTFPMSLKKKLSPKRVTLTQDSSLKLGLPSDPTLNSKIETISNGLKDDVFSVWHGNNILKCELKIELTSKEVINLIETNWIKKDNQLVQIKIENEYRETLYNGTLVESLILNPIEVNTIYLTFVCKSPNQTKPITFDLQEISLFSCKFKDTLTIETIAYPTLSNSFLTLESTLPANQEKFASLIVTSNSKILNSFSSGNQFLGPFKNPSFLLTYTITDKTELQKALQPKNKYSKINQGNAPSLIKEDVYKNKAYRVSATKEGQTLWPLFQIPNPGQHLYQLYLDGKEMNESSYTLNLTGRGIEVTTLPTPIGSTLSIEAPYPMSSYEDSTNTVTLHNGAIDTVLKFNLFTDLKTEYHHIVPSQIETYYLKENIQTFKFLNLQETEIQLEDNKFTLDYKNGCLKILDNSITDIVKIEYKYLVKEEKQSTCTDPEGQIKLDIRPRIFRSTFIPPLLLSSPRQPFFYSQNKNIIAPLVCRSTRLSLPKNITLVKSTASWTSKQEVPFIDGRSEFFTSTPITYKLRYIGTDTANTNIFMYQGAPSMVLSNIEKCNHPYARKQVGTIQDEGDWSIDTSNNICRIYCHDSSFPQANIILTENNIIKTNLFSIDYKNNHIYWARDFEMNPNDLRLTLQYILLEYDEYTLAKYIKYDKDILLKDNQEYIYQVKEKDLTEFYTPKLESLSIGVIG